MPLTFPDSFISAAMARGFSKSAAAQLLRVHDALERAESDINFRTSFETKLAQSYTDNVMGRLGNAVGQGVGKAKSLFGALKAPFAAPTANYSTPGTYAQPSAPTGWEPPAQLDLPDNPAGTKDFFQLKRDQYLNGDGGRRPDDLPYFAPGAPAAPAADKGLMQSPTPPAAPTRADINAGAVAGPAAATQAERAATKSPPVTTAIPSPAAIEPVGRAPVAPPAAPSLPKPAAPLAPMSTRAPAALPVAAPAPMSTRAPQMEPARTPVPVTPQPMRAVDPVVRGTGIYRTNPATGRKEEVAVGGGYVGRNITTSQQAVNDADVAAGKGLVAGQAHIPGRGVVDSSGGVARRQQLISDAALAASLPDNTPGADARQMASADRVTALNRANHAPAPVYDPAAVMPTNEERLRLAEQALARERAGRFAASARNAGAYAPTV